MVDDVERRVRGPDAYRLARAALDAMESQKVWPTAQNFELWLHYVANPQGAVGQAIDRVQTSGEAVTDAISDELANEHLPRQKLNGEIMEAGDQLTRQLDSINTAIATAQKSSAEYGETLAGATRQLTDPAGPPALDRLVAGLTSATRRVQRENNALEKRLTDSTEEVRRLREHLESTRRDAMTDALTSLANRKALDERLHAACEEARLRGGALSIAVIDIDHFKRFNDTWGHQTGDQVLRYVSSVIGRVGDPPRLAARYGGEEFAIVFPGEAVASVVAELDEMRQEVGSRTLKRRSTNEDLGAVTISIGVADFVPGESAAAFLGRADEALYASKRGGRDRLSIAGQASAAA